MPSVGARAEAAAWGLERQGRDLPSRSGAVKEAGVPFGGAAGSASVRPLAGDGGAGASSLFGNGEGGMDDRFSEAGRIVTEFSKFEKLTSVHVNSTDDHMLASGYTFGVRLFDVATGQVGSLDILPSISHITRVVRYTPPGTIFSAGLEKKSLKPGGGRGTTENAGLLEKVSSTPFSLYRYTFRNQCLHCLLSLRLRYSVFEDCPRVCVFLSHV